MYISMHGFGAINLCRCSSLFSDKLYKEIRDLNLHVVVQVHSTGFTSCISCVNELCTNVVVQVVMQAAINNIVFWSLQIILTAGRPPKGNVYSARLCRSKINECKYKN